MAKQKGFIKLEGSLEGLTFYERNGKSIVRTTGGNTKERIKTDPAFRRTRENMSEFGASATIGKSFRVGFSSIIKTMSGSIIVGRIVQMLKRVNTVGTGLRGQRSFNFSANKELLEGFEFNSSKPLSTIFYAPFEAPTVDANRSEVTWVVPDFNTSNFIKAPLGATHFKLVLNVTVLSDYVYSSSLGRYTPTNETENETNGVAFSNEIALGGVVGNDTTLVVDLGFGAPLPLSVAVVCAVGIIFYQQINTEFYELSSDNAMQIVSVV